MLQYNQYFIQLQNADTNAPEVLLFYMPLIDKKQQQRTNNLKDSYKEINLGTIPLI
jgi:hypothetical protein